MHLSRGDMTKSDGYKATYVASWAAFTPITSTMFSITGSATKTINILRIGISGTQTTAGVVRLQLNKVATITGGTTVAPTAIVPFDSTSPAATATPVIYTVTNSSATGTQFTRFVYYLVPTPTAITSAQDEYIFDFTNTYNQTMVVRGTEAVAVLLNTAATGISFCMWVEWTEE